MKDATVEEPKAKGRHGGEARTWTYSHGLPPHTVYARELELGGIIQVRYTDPSKDGRDKRVRKHLDMVVRKAPDAEVDPKLEKKVQARIIAANGRLVAGLPAFDEPAPATPVERAPTAPTQETLTLLAGFELALDEETGKYASTETRRYGDMKTLRDILFEPGMLDPNLTWAELRYSHVVALWRRMAAIHKKDPDKFGPRRAEVVVDALYSVASWLRKREHIASNAAVPVDGWRTELVQEWEEKTNRPVQVSKPRHSVAEARAIFASLWHPARLRYRELLRVTEGGGHRALVVATRQNIVRDHTGRPIALRLRVVRERRDGTTDTVSVRVPLDDRARAALAPVDTPEAAPDAPFFDAAVVVLEVDPRIELAVELGAEMRLGQVGEARRSQLDLTRTPMAPHGTFTVYGKKKKAGEKLALTQEQRVAVDHALETVLADAEAAYDPADRRTDYYLLPSGKLVQGAADVERARRAPITRDALRKAFHALEVAAGVTPVEGRGWYGLRRVSTDEAPRYTSDRRVMDKLGGWTAGSTTREDTYQDREDELLIAETAAVRRAWRAGEKMGPEGIPASSEALLALLPEALRAAVLAHFGQVPTTSGVGTTVGTNDNAAGIEDSDGVLSR
jgi:hypothetical protein